MKFFPNFMLRELMAWYVALGVLGALAAIFPWNLGDQSRSICIGPSRNQARVVLPLYVSDAEADSAKGMVH